jgi:sugar lactone lactonase YvrE
MKKASVRFGLRLFGILPVAPRRVISGMLLVSAFGVLLPEVALAQFKTHVVMSGLENPRGLAFSPDGSLYVTEAGSPFAPGDDTPFVLNRGQPSYYHTSGAISRLQDGVQSRVITDLPSLFSPSSGDNTGPHGIGFNAAGDMYFTVGLGSDPATRTGVLGNLGLLMRVPAGESVPVVVADISNYETLHNPAGGLHDSNPFQLAVGAGGIFVADAGANAVLNVSSSGSVSLVSTLDALPGGIEAVPTSLTVATDGTVYVSQLTGAPFPEGGASVFRVDGSTLTSVATGFTNVIDITTGPDGSLYVLELAHFGLASGNPTGGLWKVDPQSGAKQLLFSDGLFLPTAIEFSADGDLYVANQGLIPGQGEVLLLSPVPEPSTFGAVAAALLVGLIGKRRWRRTQKIAA